jgi:hypothetical protein
MKALKVELLILDFDGVGPEGARTTLEHTRFPNDCILPRVLNVEERDIGEWSDDHPLNHGSTQAAEVARIFGNAQ